MVCWCQASLVPLEMNDDPQRFFLLMVAIFGERSGGGGGGKSVVYFQPKLFVPPIRLEVWKELQNLFHLTWKVFRISTQQNV